VPNPKLRFGSKWLEVHFPFYTLTLQRKSALNEAYNVQRQVVDQMILKKFLKNKFVHSMSSQNLLLIIINQRVRLLK